MLFSSVGLYVGFVVLYGIFNNPNLIPAQFFIGAVAVPASVLCLFFELNILRNVSLFRVGRFVLVGGVVSFMYSLLLYMFQNEEMSVFWAGPIEEFGKLLAMIVIAEGADRLKSSALLGIIGLPFDLLIGKGAARGAKYGWTLNGILFGASVGVGFAVFETMGYALGALFENGPAAMLNTIFLRGVLSPFGHVVWSAICGGALWRVRGAGEWHWGKLFHLRLVVIFVTVSFLHGLWDVACNDPNCWIWFAGIGIVSWIIVLLQVRSGIREVRLCQHKTAAVETPTSISCPHCGAVYAYNSNLIGVAVRCSACANEFVVE